MASKKIPDLNNKPVGERKEKNPTKPFLSYYRMQQSTLD